MRPFFSIVFLSFSLFAISQTGPSSGKSNPVKTAVISIGTTTKNCGTKALVFASSGIFFDSCYKNQKTSPTRKRIIDDSLYALVYGKTVDGWKKIKKEMDTYIRAQHCDLLYPNYILTLYSDSNKYSFTLTNAPNCYPTLLRN